MATDRDIFPVKFNDFPDLQRWLRVRWPQLKDAVTALESDVELVDDRVTGVEDASYVWAFGPQDFGYMDGGAAYTRIGANLLHSAISLPDGGTSRLHIEKFRPSNWTGGTLRLTIYYTGDVSSTNNIRILVAIGTQVVGATLDDTTTSDTQDLPGPATASDEKSYTFTTTWAIDSSHRHVAIKIARVGAHANDTYTGNCLLTQAIVEYIPS